LGDNHLLRRNKNYRILWLANSGSILGDWFNQVALGQVTLLLTNSPSAMGIVLLCRSLPSVLLGPVVSPLVDRYSKKKIMLISDFTRALFALLFPLGVFFHMMSPLFVGAILLGICSILFSPAQQATLPLILPGRDLAQANSINSGTYGFLSILGAVSGGIVAALVTPVLCFLINALSYLWSAVWILHFNIAEPVSGKLVSESWLCSLREGLHEAATNKIVRAIMIIGISWGFAGGGYAILIPLLGQMVYKMGGFGIGLLYSIDGMGVLLGAFLVNKFIGSNDNRVNRWYGIDYLTQAVFFALLCQSALFIYGAVFLLLMRISSGIIIPLDSYLIQRHTRPEIRGRIFALHNSTYSGVMQLSYACFGYLFEKFGINKMGIFIGLISFLCGLTWLLNKHGRE
jgi:Arabinose efflux permease